MLSEEVQKFPTPTSSMMTIQDMEQARFSGNDPKRPKYREACPTPTTPRPHDSENTVGKYYKGQKQKDLTYQVARNGGQLNPQFVAWLMGYPLAWSDMRADLQLSLIKE